MAFVRTKMPEKYKVEDMPIAATFVSTEDAPHLGIILIPTEEKYDEARKQFVSMRGTSVRVKFKVGRLRINNSLILQMLLDHKAFGAGTHGFNIDERDETGFWRALDMVKVKKVEVAVSVGHAARLVKLSKKELATRLNSMGKDLEGKTIEPLEKASPQLSVRLQTKKPEDGEEEIFNPDDVSGKKDGGG